MRQDGAGLAQHALADSVVAGERTGVRFGRAPPGAGAAGLVDDDRLAASDAAQRGKELAPLLEPLDISDDDLRVLVFSEIVEILVELDVGLIANPDIGAEADIAVGFRLSDEG